MLVQKKKWGKKNTRYVFLRKRLTIVGLFDGLWSVSTFSPLAPALGPEHKTGHVTFPLFMAVSMIRHM